MTNQTKTSSLIHGTWIWIAVLTLCGAPLPGAEPGDREPRRRVARHCVAHLEAVEGAPAALGVREAKVARTTCYSAFSDAIFDATNGAVWLPPDDDFASQLETLEKELEVSDSKSSFVLAIDYEHASYGGSSRTWSASSGCSPSLGWRVGAIESAWNDRISSTKGFSNCNQNILWEHTNYSGANQPCTPNCSGLGVMNDAASSREWYY